ncbi:unnamed protein product [Rotaria sordida]|uniref:UDENN domain-containing protein n=1 Tax=Rotaria sordida TaxID=392033 RepID=A0A814NPZ6_9BILA|nr:unnamed protein product [Rotaria sordida]
MKANHSDHHLHETSSLNISFNNDGQDEEDDTKSWSNLNIQQNSNTLLNHRRLSIKRLTNTVNNHNVSHGNGLIINGSLFDGQLFQPLRSSYIIDYRETPRDLNKFLEGHNTILNSSHLDLHLFKLSFLMTLSEGQIDKELLLDYYPRDNNEINIVEEISYYKRFCFPELNSKKTTTEENLLDDSLTYIFTRTNSIGKVEYGYCRRVTHANNQITKFPIVICIVSTYSYFKLYDAILNELTSAYLSNVLECNLLMQSFYSKPLPVPTPNSSGIVCILNDRRLFFYVCPTDERLNHDYFSTLLSCLTPNNITYLFESMLRSKRILCFSNSLSKLTKCCLGLSFLMYPFMWPYPFVSLMPSSWLHDLLDSPCPYIYGCLYETMKQIPTIIEKDSIRVDLDLNTINSGINDGFILPLDLRQILQASLEYLTRFRLIKLNSTLINIAVSEACLHVFTELFYNLPRYFQRHQTSIKLTDNERKSSISLKSFKRDDSGIDIQSVVSNDIQHESKYNNEHKQEENRFGYDFRSDEFLIAQPTSGYVVFLNDFIHGMIFLKFLDDYQRIDNNSVQSFSLFSQRLNERRRMTNDELLINPVVRFRRTFDLLEKQMKNSSKSTNSSITKIVKKFFE